MSTTLHTRRRKVEAILKQEGQRHPLDPLFNPRSVAIIGATETPGSVGRTLVENLNTPQFANRLFPINPRRSTVLGLPAHPSLAQLPTPIDLAVIATPAAAVPGVIAECVQHRVPGAIIISAGFKECGPAGVQLEQDVLHQARQNGIRIIGPNCLGAMIPHLGFNATFATTIARPGNVAFISQSGALCTAVLDWSLHENVGFSAFVSVGSMLDVGWGDLLYYFGDDPRTRSIVIYMESVGDARSFLSAAREVALSKPIIVIKVGRTQAAAQAAASHTGSLTGSDDVLDAAFRRVGVLRVDRIDELFDMAEVLSKQPRPKGPRLTIVTNAGGPGVLATDALITSGGTLAQPSPETRQALDKLLPPHWSHNNPIDILGDAGPDRYARAIDLVARDPESDGLLVILTPQAMTDPTRTAEQLKPFAQLGGKPILASWMGGAEVQPGEDLLNQAGIPTFDYPDTAARAFVYMWSYSQHLRSIYETPMVVADTFENSRRQEQARTFLEAARAAHREILTEYEAKQVLQAYGIPTVPTRIATTEEEAVRLAAEIGQPSVLKLHSETLTHKTDVGGVELNLQNPDEVRAAWHRIRNAVTQKAGPQHFLGVTVQPMVSRSGYELILGSSPDPQFGPVLLFGTGGQLVEVFRDSALGLPPLTATLARRLMEQTRIFTALQGVRGRPPVNLSDLEQLLVRFSYLAVEQPWIREIDINPLLASPAQLLALDARIILHPASTPAHQLPRPAIRPYPVHYVTSWRTRTGMQFTLRPIRPEDEPLMVRLHETLSEQSVYHRYFNALGLGQRIAHERLTRICFNDYDREIALVAEYRDPKSGSTALAGVGRLIKLHGHNHAEFAVLVGDPWQGKGLGTELLKRLVAIAREERIDRLTATILPQNKAMQHLCRKAGFQVRHPANDADYIARLDLANPAPSPAPHP